MALELSAPEAKEFLTRLLKGTENGNPSWNVAGEKEIECQMGDSSLTIFRNDIPPGLLGSSIKLVVTDSLGEGVVEIFARNAELKFQKGDEGFRWKAMNAIFTIALERQDSARTEKGKKVLKDLLQQLPAAEK